VFEPDECKTRSAFILTLPFVDVVDGKFKFPAVTTIFPEVAVISPEVAVSVVPAVMDPEIERLVVIDGTPDPSVVSTPLFAVARAEITFVAEAYNKVFAAFVSG
jgi:hypothetical protein